MKPHIAVLVSGPGTNLAALLDNKIPVGLVLADRTSGAIKSAAMRKIPSTVLLYPSEAPLGASRREAYTRQVLDRLAAFEINFVISAGFGRILDPAFCRHFGDHALNMHPSYLPEFPGKDAVEQALAAGAKETGCTLHVMAPQVDSGRIILQRRIKVLPQDTVESLHQRIKEMEHTIYPIAIRKYLLERGFEL